MREEHALPDQQAVGTGNGAGAVAAGLPIEEHAAVPHQRGGRGRDAVLVAGDQGAHLRAGQCRIGDAAQRGGVAAIASAALDDRKADDVLDRAVAVHGQPGLGGADEVARLLVQIGPLLLRLPDLGHAEGEVLADRAAGEREGKGGLVVGIEGALEAIVAGQMRDEVTDDLLHIAQSAGALALGQVEDRPEGAGVGGHLECSQAPLAAAHEGERADGSSVTDRGGPLEIGSAGCFEPPSLLKNHSGVGRLGLGKARRRGERGAAARSVLLRHSTPRRALSTETRVRSPVVSPPTCAPAGLPWRQIQGF